MVFAEKMKVKPRSIAFPLKPANGKQVFTDGGDDHAKVSLWDTATKRILRTYGDCPHGVRAIAVSKDGKYVAAGTGGGKVLVWDALSTRVVGDFVTKDGECGCIAFTPDSKKVIFGGEDARLHDIASGKLLMKYKLKGAGFHAIRFTPSGKEMVVISHTPDIYYMDVEDKSEPIVLTGHVGHVHLLEISPDGTLIATGGQDNTVRVWSLKKSQELLSFPRRSLSAE